jgi:hypothetical protein
VPGQGSPPPTSKQHDFAQVTLAEGENREYCFGNQPYAFLSHGFRRQGRDMGGRGCRCVSGPALTTHASTLGVSGLFTLSAELRCDPAATAGLVHPGQGLATSPEVLRLSLTEEQAVTSRAAMEALECWCHPLPRVTLTNNT